MAGLFKKGFNKYAEVNTAFGKKLNQVIGTDFFKECPKIEDPREFPPYDSFPNYTAPEPEQWTPFSGSAKEFTLEGSTVSVSANLDACMQYKPLFKSAAKHYAEQFKFKYSQCVTDYDSFLHYFKDMYMEGLNAMVERAYSLLLPFNVFNVNKDKFLDYQISTYHQAIDSYQIMFSVEQEKNQAAKNLGNVVGNSVQMEGGGFGVKGAAKGFAKAEAFNIGMGLLGKLVEHSSKLTPQEKAEVFSKLNVEAFFNEVYFDYYNTFCSTIQILSENGVLGEVSTLTGEEYNTMVTNLNNPMFPQDKVAPLLAKLISQYPFTLDCYEVLKKRYGETAEVKALMNYFDVA